jgi:tetratricopeptide (TPR) repeat protein
MTATQRVVEGLTRDEVLPQLERILSDERFASADRNSGFLRYVVEKTLDGKASEIKEVVIATEIYGRASDYDPKVDSVVRVEASRLRSKLNSYYAQQGAQDPVRITIPKGSYVPQFERVQTPEAPAPSTPEVSPPPYRPRALWLRALAASRSMVALGVSGLSVVLWLAIGSARVTDPQNRAPHPEALVAWQEGVELLRQDPNSAVTESGMPPTLVRAIERYEFAVARDPSFATGWASLAEAYDYASVYAGRNRDEDVRRAEAAARRAIELNQNLAAGHAMLGLVLFYSRFDYAAAEKSYRRAIDLDPRSTYAIIEYSDLLRVSGRLDEAEAQIRKARALQPGLPVLAVKQAEIQLDRKLPDAAIVTLTEALRLRHDVRRAHVALGMAWEAKGDFERALACYREALGMNPQDRRALPALGYLLGVMGRREEALAVARQLENMNANVRNCAFQVAVVYSGLGEREKAFEWLERAYRTKQAAIPHMAIEYRFRPLRQHPLFQAILNDVGLKPVREAASLHD